MSSWLGEAQRQFAQALKDPTAAAPVGIVAADIAHAKRRFGIYRNNVAASLVDALADSFPVTRTLVGSEFFRAMARVYTSNFKPKSPVLLHYGDDFPDFIESFEPAALIPYLADVARVEAAWLSAYHAADCEPCSASAIVALDQNTIDMRVKFLPSMELVRSNYPAGSIWLAHQADGHFIPEEWTPETVMVFRPAMQVQTAILSGSKSIFVSALSDGCTIAEAASTAIAEDKMFDPGTALLELVNARSIEAFQRKEG